ncbi:Protein of unknown function [Gryllus bimaculatus]|nr:Protein of unknown function [Gryllus bimaculatus]
MPLESRRLWACHVNPGCSLILENMDDLHGKLSPFYLPVLYSRWGLYPYGMSGAMPLHRRMHVESSSDHEECWAKVAVELDKRFKDKEESVISRIHSKHAATKRNLLILINCKRSAIEKALTDKLTELIEQKVEALERQICQKIGERFRAMEERIQAIEWKIVNRRRNMGIGGVGTVEEEAVSSEERTETHFCSEVIKNMGEMDARLAVLEAVTQKSVTYFFPKVEVMLRHVNLSS